MPKSAAARKSEAPPAFKGVVGKQVVIKLASVEKNPWNPNRMTKFQFESLKQGLAEDGWLSSDALLIWGKDDKGKAQNLIINGEHRQRAALELGMKEGPAVILNGLTAAQAKALTIKLDNKRGQFDPDGLAALVQSIQFDLGAADLGMALGIEGEALMKMLAFEAEKVAAAVAEATAGLDGAAIVHSENPHVKMVPLYFDETQYAEFEGHMRTLRTKFGTLTVTDTVLEGVKRLVAE